MYSNDTCTWHCDVKIITAKFNYQNKFDIKILKNTTPFKNMWLVSFYKILGENFKIISFI